MEASQDNFDGFKFAIIQDGSSESIAAEIQSRAGVVQVFDFELPRSGQPGQRDPAMADFANRVLTAEIETVVFVTGAGFNQILDLASQYVDRQRWLDCLNDATSVAGSSIVAIAMREAGIEPTIEADGSWRDILITMDRLAPVTNKTIGLEQSAAIHGLAGGFEARGAKVVRVPAFNHLAPQHVDPIVDFFEQIEARDFQVILLASPETAARYWFLAERNGRTRLTKHLLDNHIVLSIGDDTSEILKDRGILVDYESKQPSVELAMRDIAENFSQITKQKSIIRVNMSGPASSNSDQNAPWYNSSFMKACRGEPTDVTPIWMMRQAGRYMQEYREVRDKVSFLDLCANPQLCSEVMCTAVNRLGVDAAIIFSDLLPILVPMGCDLEFVKGDGPVIHNPVRAVEDLNRIKPLESNDELQFVMDTVKQTRLDLPADMPLIGFAGAPFTLASYMIEGGASRNYALTKMFMAQDRGAWKQLMEHLSHSISIYLNGQIEAGAQCIQLFDSWAGCLSFEDYRQYVHPHVKQIIASLPSNVPVINFATGNPSLLPLLADTRAAVVGIDWRTRLDDAWQTVGYDRAVQGNLDPTVLLTNPDEIRRQAKSVLDQAAGRPGHIFNLGHGILPQTPVDNAIALVDAVHELSQK